MPPKKPAKKKAAKNPAAKKRAAKKAPAERKKSRILKVDWNGCAPLPIYRRKLRRAARIAIECGCYVTSTTGGTHSPGSWHYSGRAIDFGSGGPGESPEIRAQNALLRKFGAGKFKELFGPDDWYIKNGVRYSGTFPNHGDHLHVAI